MPNQHTIEEAVKNEVILVPLDLAEFHIVNQEWLANGTIRVAVMATTTQATCPHCHKQCVKIHNTRPRKKRDRALREHRVELIVLKRRFRCLRCRKAFAEPDTACGWRRKTTARLREEIGKLACTQPISHVATTAGVGPRFVQACFHTVALQQLKGKGLNLDEQQPLDTPEFLGIDEFARRKGHCYDTILCDLGARQVLEVSAGRKQEEVITLLERLRQPDAVKAVNMDMSASYRPAVQLCLPKAHIVVDHFHVMQHVMKGFKKVLQSWAHKKEGKPVKRQLNSTCALPHQKFDLTFFKKHTLCRSVLRFQPVHHYIDFPSLKTQQAPKLCYKGQIPGDVIRDSHVGKGISLRRVPREAHVESGLSLQTRRELQQQMIPQYCQATTVKKKSKLLDAFTVTTGYNLKYAM